MTEHVTEHLSTQVRAAIREEALAAPFWRRGGTLYVHTMVPHPPGAASGPSLNADYAANLELAADLAADLAHELKTRFSEWYRFIITSDHPLRPQVWCGPLRYSEPDCLTNTRFLATLVPLIAVGPAAPDLTGLATNRDLMNRLTAAP